MWKEGGSKHEKCVDRLFEGFRFEWNEEEKKNYQLLKSPFVSGMAHTLCM